MCIVVILFYIVEDIIEDTFLTFYCETVIDQLLHLEYCIKDQEIRKYSKRLTGKKTKFSFNFTKLIK